MQKKIQIVNFDYTLYLEANPDVKEAIEKGEIKDAKEHFEKFGLEEIRKGLRKFHPHYEPYNEEKYLELNLDVREAIEKGSFKNGWHHFCLYGYNEIIGGLREYRILNCRKKENDYVKNNDKLLITIVGVPRSGLTLFTALMMQCNNIATFSLPFQIGKLEQPPLTFEELQDKLKTNSKFIALSSSISDMDLFRKVKDTVSNLKKSDVLVKYIWILRDYNSVYLSLKEASYKFWGAKNIDINEESYKNFFNFFFKGYENIVEECLLNEHVLISYKNLITSSKIELKNFIGLDCDVENIDYDYLRSCEVYGDPSFKQYDYIDSEREERRKKEWKNYKHFFDVLNEKQQSFVNFFNKLVKDVEEKKVKTFKDFILKEAKKIFDENFYLEQYPDIKEQQVDAWEHFLEYGWREGRQPNKHFNTNWYKENICKIDEINPFLHYVAIGRFIDIDNNIQKGKMKNLIIIDPENYKITDDLILEVPKFAKPKVSIIIPAYNQHNYTLACIESIIKNTKDVSYEIIVMDDKSPNPEAQAIEKYLKNIKFVVNGINYGFLKNCNKGAKFAIGEYLLFLNNDTNPQPGWLSSLVELIESADDIGMVGSRLVYPDGQQQEAGGIVWNDASAWNYGRYDDPNKPEYNYVKESDYLTGASMMIRRDIWEEIGGFDERYAPAYYEDTDIAFEVRKRGYRTLYQPRSVVIHFEGVSNGTDIGSGIKSFQSINKDKFFEKWKDVLQRDHFPNAENVFLARDRSRYKKHILFVDHYIPHYDQDAGSKAVYQYLKILAKNNMQIHFIGDNFYDYPGTSYLDALTQLGIEVLYGDWYANNWKNWLKENGKYLDYVILSRPHIAPKYIDEVKRFTKAKIIYMGHDLHFLRELREYEVKGDIEYLKNSEKWKKIEIDLIRQADMSWYFSEIEKNILKKEDPSLVVDVVPLYIYEKFPDIVYKAEKRRDIMFVGGFNHKPNVDAIIWFVEEIWPLFIKSNPGVHFYIIGSNPPSEILTLNGKNNITVTGFISDEELEKFYRHCRMMVAPLRYGAGVKGKIVDALYYGMPVVTTSIGAEGIIGIEKIIPIADEAEKFANILNFLYNSPKDLEEISVSEQKYCKEHFSENSAKKIMKNIIVELE